jgi:Na+-transporting NADH:ubiquinone oxidoreductase subunit NqrB
MSLIDRLRGSDPRLWQIGVLASLLLYGLTVLGFDTDAGRVALIVGTALAAQWAATRIWKLPFFDPRSALISALSLCLLLRTRFWWLAVVIALVTIFSKFVLRWRGKHIFNPTNFGLALGILFVPGVWVSSGQWGSFAIFASFMICLGSLVIHRAERSDVTIAFLLSWCGLLLARATWLGDPWAIPFHQLQSGALLLFSFFMISDPKTTPDSRPGRILFAFLVACGAYYIQFKLFTPNGLLLSLVGCSLLVPLIDILLPGGRYVWLPHRRLQPAT